MIKNILTITLFLCCTVNLLAANGNKMEPNLHKNIDKQKMNQWVDSVYQTLSLDERIGQLFIVVSPGNNSQATKTTLKNSVQNAKLGGLLFSKSTPAHHAELTNLAQSVSKVPLMVTLDGEWGLSMRLSGTTKFPRNMMLGAVQNDSLIYKYGYEVARQCREVGIHVNFAPDIDVNSNPDNPVIGSRSFGENPELVSRLGILYSKGLEDGGVMAVSKHFPGHGDTSTDSHHTLPVISHSRARLDSVEIVPFSDYINAGLSGIMVAHLDIKALGTEGKAASLSKNVVTDLLQNELGFTGLIFTDGLQMKGVTVEDDYCVKALLAGNDMLLGPLDLMKEYKSVQKAVKDGVISEELINERCRKVLVYKYIIGVHKNTKVNLNGLSARLNTTYADKLNRQLHQEAITLVKDESNLVPLKGLDKRKIAVVSIGGNLNSRFVQSLRKYASVSSFAAADNAAALALKTKLAGYNTIIFAVQSKANASSAIVQLGKDKETILTFFTVPYQMADYASAIGTTDAVLVGYENTSVAHDAAAQAIFGGATIDGRLPVSVADLFDAGTGIVKKKVD